MKRVKIESEVELESNLETGDTDSDGELMSRAELDTFRAGLSRAHVMARDWMLEQLKAAREQNEEDGASMLFAGITGALGYVVGSEVDRSPEMIQRVLRTMMATLVRCFQDGVNDDLPGEVREDGPTIQ